MTPLQAADILKRHNAWRRGHDAPPGQRLSAEELGTALDTAVEALERAYKLRRCESNAPDCGPVMHEDDEGVPLCARCYADLTAETATQRRAREAGLALVEGGRVFPEIAAPEVPHA